MWQLAQGREAMVRKEREAKEAQAGDVLDVHGEAGGFRSVGSPNSKFFCF